MCGSTLTWPSGAAHVSLRVQVGRRARRGVVALGLTAWGRTLLSTWFSEEALSPQGAQEPGLTDVLSPMSRAHSPKAQDRDGTGYYSPVLPSTGNGLAGRQGSPGARDIRELTPRCPGQAGWPAAPPTPASRDTARAAALPQDLLRGPGTHQQVGALGRAPGSSPCPPSRQGRWVSVDSAGLPLPRQAGRALPPWLWQALSGAHTQAPGQDLRPHITPQAAISGVLCIHFPTLLWVHAPADL